jgi:hypothetical protein
MALIVLLAGGWEATMIRLSDATVLDLIADLHRSDEQTGGHPVLSPDRIGTARTYLEQLLLDPGDRLRQHIVTLERWYQAKFIAPLPRSWHLGVDVPRPQPAAEFRHSTPLPESLALAVTEGGVDRLPEDELARLLLNPYALLDLADLINTQLPDYWLDRVEKVGVQLARESGIDLYEDFNAVVGTKELPGGESKPALGASQEHTKTEETT